MSELVIPKGKAKLSKTLARGLFALPIRQICTQDEWELLKEDFPTLTEDVPFEFVQNLVVAKIGLFGKDSDRLSAYVHMNNRVHGLPKAEIETSTKFVQLDALSAEDAKVISEGLEKKY